MAGILVMGIALGLQEGGKKIKEKRDERKAKKAALVTEAYAPAESSTSRAAQEARSAHRISQRENKSEEAHREQQRRSLSSERGMELERDAPPSYDEIPRPMYEEAMRTDQRRR
ncbi:hypothetical protein G6514_003244 [Epicoccum nigrum]|nr:hypothetical protein G6514_003244 [Epicoccum nigrum]